MIGMTAIIEATSQGGFFVGCGYNRFITFEVQYNKDD